MNPHANLKKLVPKNKNKNFFDDAPLSFSEVKREKSIKRRRNYDNALRSKNLDRLLSYDDD